MGRGFLGPRHRWENNIKMNTEEMGHKSVCWIHLAQDSVQWWSLVNKVMIIRVTYGTMNYWTR
jgi:hypothetical protein